MGVLRMQSKALLALVLLTVVSAVAPTEGPADFSIDSYTIDGGGETSSAGDFSLTATIGQPDANPGGASGGEFSVFGGFWDGIGPVGDLLFEDGFEDH